jgi:hypothetical protein
MFNVIVGGVFCHLQPNAFLSGVLSPLKPLLPREISSLLFNKSEVSSRHAAQSIPSLDQAPGLGTGVWTIAWVMAASDKAL